MVDSTMVAVYGTLKRGMTNHRLLEGARYVGNDLLTSISLYDLGEYPAALQELSDGVQVEIFAVNAAQIEELDLLEEYDADNPEVGLYRRCVCQTRYGEVWIYIYNRAVDGMPRISGGDWSPSRHS